MKFDIGPFHATGWHTIQLLNASYSACCCSSARSTSLRSGGDRPRPLRALTIANLVVGLLLAV